MPDHYDRLENRTPGARESTLFRDLRHVLSVTRSRAPALRAQLKGVDVNALTSRADLAAIPLRRRADLVALQADTPPFGGLGATRLGALRHAFLSPDSLLAMGGVAKDWWGMGRGLFAAGLRKGSLVLNCFSYDLQPYAHMVDAGALAIGCPVVPAGNADLDRKVEAVARLEPRFFCGDSEHLRALLDRGMDRGVDMTSLEGALVTGASNAGLRSELSLRGIGARHAFALPDLGLVAFESGATDGFTVNEGLIVEIVDPASGAPVAPGMPGEIVVSRVNADYPLLRYATGFLSAQLAQPSSCGRTNMRIREPRDMAPESADVCGQRIHIADIREIAKRHPEAGRMRLVMRRRREADELVLEVEHKGGDGLALHAQLSETLHAIISLRGTVELVQPGTLSDDDTVIVDERPLN